MPRGKRLEFWRKSVGPSRFKLEADWCRVLAVAKNVDIEFGCVELGLCVPHAIGEIAIAIRLLFECLALW